MQNVAVITPIPTPYRDPLWSALAQRPDIDLQVFYCAGGKADRPWEASWRREFSHEVLPGRNLLAWKGADASCFWNGAISSRLRREPFDAIIVGGYNHVTMWAAMRYAVSRKIPYYLMCETFAPRSRRRWKEWMVRQAIQGAAGGFPTGVLAEKYLVRYGLPPDRLARIPNAPDVENIAETVAELRSRREELRAQKGLDNRKVILFCGRLIPKKRPALLVRAFHQAGLGNNAQLAIVGDGPERQAVEGLVNELGLAGSVHFAGFVQPDKIAPWYALADMFVLPSSETWGVVALEALAAGLPVVLSDEVGCGPDVLVDARLGEFARAGDLAALSAAIAKVFAASPTPEVVNAVWGGVRRSLSYEGLAERISLALNTPTQRVLQAAGAEEAR